MIKLLLIDDDILFQRTIKSLLGDSFNVDVCCSADEFYSDYYSSNYDIIIMDISLKGGKDGLQLTKEIKKMPNFFKTPILCLTAHAFSHDKKNAYDAGVDLYLSKPVMRDLLVKEIINLTSID